MALWEVGAVINPILQIQKLNVRALKDFTVGIKYMAIFFFFPIPLHCLARMAGVRS